MVEVTVGHYRYSDAYEPSKSSSTESDVKTRRQKFAIYDVQAVIEQMDDKECAEQGDVVIKRSHSSKPVEAAAHSGSSKKKRKLRSDDRYSGSDSSKVDDDLEDVEPDDSQDDFINKITTKLQALASDLRTGDTKHSPVVARERKNKLSLKKTGVNTINQECTDSKDRHGTKNMGTRLLARAPANDLVMPAAVKQTPTATKLLDVRPTENMYEWDIIESLSGSDSGDNVCFESKPSDMWPTFYKHKSVDAEMPKRACKMVIPCDADKKKQTPVGQLIKSDSRPRKNLKYCDQKDLLDGSEEIMIEEGESDVADEDFLSLVSGSPAAASVKGRSSKSGKSVYDTGDEFVSYLRYYKHLFVLLLCFLLQF